MLFKHFCNLIYCIFLILPFSNAFECPRNDERCHNKLSELKGLALGRSWRKEVINPDSDFATGHLVTVEENPKQHYFYDKLGDLTFNGWVKGKSSQVPIFFAKDEHGYGGNNKFLAIHICVEKEKSCEAGFVLCYKGQLDPKNNAIKKIFQIENLNGNDIASECNKNVDGDGVQHGIAISTDWDGIQEIVKITTSFSEQLISFPLPKERCLQIRFGDILSPLRTTIEELNVPMIYGEDSSEFPDLFNGRLLQEANQPLPWFLDLTAFESGNPTRISMYGRDSGCYMNAKITNNYVSYKYNIQPCKSFWMDTPKSLIGQGLLESGPNADFLGDETFWKDIYKKTHGYINNETGIRLHTESPNFSKNWLPIKLPTDRVWMDSPWLVCHGYIFSLRRDSDEIYNDAINFVDSCYGGYNRMWSISPEEVEKIKQNVTDEILFQLPVGHEIRRNFDGKIQLERGEYPVFDKIVLINAFEKKFNFSASRPDGFTGTRFDRQSKEGKHGSLRFEGISELEMFNRCRICCEVSEKSCRPCQTMDQKVFKLNFTSGAATLKDVKEGMMIRQLMFACPWKNTSISYIFFAPRIIIEYSYHTYVNLSEAKIVEVKNSSFLMQPETCPPSFATTTEEPEEDNESTVATSPEPTTVTIPYELLNDDLDQALEMVGTCVPQWPFIKNASDKEIARAERKKKPGIIFTLNVGYASQGDLRFTNRVVEEAFAVKFNFSRAPYWSPSGFQKTTIDTTNTISTSKVKDGEAKVLVNEEYGSFTIGTLFETETFRQMSKMNVINLFPPSGERWGSFREFFIQQLIFKCQKGTQTFYVPRLTMLRYDKETKTFSHTGFNSIFWYSGMDFPNFIRMLHL